MYYLLQSNYNLLTKNISIKEFSARYLVLGIGLGGVLIKNIFDYFHEKALKEKELYEVTIYFDNKFSSLTALLDTGNSLTEPFKDYLFALRQRDRRVILLLDNETSEHLGYALALGIYDIIFDPVTLDKIMNRVKNPAKFSDVQGLYLGLKGKVSFSGEEIIKPDEKPVAKAEIKTEIKPEIKPVVESKKEPEVVKNVIEIDINKQNMAINQIEGMMKLLGYKLKEKKDVNGALLELEQVLIEEIV